MQPRRSIERMAIPRACCLLFFLSSLLLLITSSIANDNNIMLTGDVLCPDCQLSYLDTSFTMQSDCNLVLYEQTSAAFSSDTYDKGSVNCSVALNQYGQFVISDPSRRTVWVSGDPSRKGNYAAVLKPNGHVGIYGPPVWCTPAVASTSDYDSNPLMDGIQVAYDGAVIPTVKNTMFSSEILIEGTELTTRDFTFAMQEGCSLELHRGETQHLWVSGTVGRGEHCFLRLNRMGQLTVKDDQYKTLWSTKPSPEGDGEYVLILQYDGQAAVYGPLIWSTSQGQISQISPAPNSPQPMSSSSVNS